ncbi:MAG: carboxypeptidase [Chloroflexi bacterium HGW-Chloroflexi-1]|nr:MAG: carboxypeptidase [Chloroflexi bacterium HGW-Chloroflexi-1]
MTNPQAKLQELKIHLIEVNDLEAANALLYWDQSTYMPEGGAAARARQSATLSKIAHERFTDPGIGKLLDNLRPYEESLPYDADDASLIRITRREYERAVKVPPAFMAELTSHQADSYQVWAAARPQNDFARVQPYLEKMLDLSRKYSDFFLGETPGYEHIADPLIDVADYGMKASTVSARFAELRGQLVPLVEAITAQQPADDTCLHRHFPEAGQWTFGLDIARVIGYDFGRGRLDKTHHPFTTEFSIGDVRITTRVDEHDLRNALFSTIHEAGHAMYEQGVNPDYEGTPLAGGTSSGVHESQSRLWENVVGRSRGFWQFYYPKLQAVFPDALADVPLDSFYRSINKVQRSLIRTEADEVTYNLHVMLRFDLELALLEGKLAVRDLPEAWRARYEADLGAFPADDKDGVMQDVHWYGGIIGGVFQGYTLGNIMSGLFWEAALRAHPEIPGEIAQGQCGTLLGWLQDNIYRHGSKYTANELIERVTGGPLTIEPYIRYLRTKYGELYEL